ARHVHHRPGRQAARQPDQLPQRPPQHGGAGPQGAGVRALQQAARGGLPGELEEARRPLAEAAGRACRQRAPGDARLSGGGARAGGAVSCRSMIARPLSLFAATTLLTGVAAAQIAPGSPPAPLTFEKGWNGAPTSFDELEGMVVILKFSESW